MDEINAIGKHDRCVYGRICSRAGTSGGGSAVAFTCHYGARTLGEFDANRRDVDPAECETCEKFQSAYIETPLTISDFSVSQPEYRSACMVPVRIRPCDEDKTFFGVLLGYFPRNTMVRFVRDTQELQISTVTNPAIFVPEKQKIYFGDESWWSRIEPGEAFPEITDEEISGQWYIRALREMGGMR